MPRIDLGYSSGNAQLTPQRGLPNTSGLSQQADAMSRLAEVGAETVAAVNRNRQNIEMAKSTTEAIKEIENKVYEFKNDDVDYSTQEKRYQDFFQDLQGRYQEKLKDPGLFQEWQRNVDKFAFNKGLDIKSNAVKQDAIAQQAILESTLGDISGIAIRGDEEQFNDSVSKADGLIEHAFDIGVLDTREREAFKQKFNNELSRGKIRQDINLDPAKALENIRSNKYSNLSAEEQSQFESMAMSKVEQIKNKSKVEAEKQANELVKDTILSLNNGYAVTDDEMAAARAASALVGKQEDLDIAAQAGKFVTLPKSVRDDLPSTIEGVNNAELRKALEVANETIETELDKDGYSFAVNQRVIDDVPLNLDDPSSIQQRIEQTEYLKSHYGRPVSPLKEYEAERLVEALEVMTPKQKVELAKTLGSAEAIWEQLDKKNAGLFSMVGAIGDAQVMENVFKGQKLIKDKLVSSTSENDYLSTFNDYVGDIYTGNDKKYMRDAALAYYAATTDSDTFDSGDFEDAIEAVSGGIGKINGHKLELPRNVPEDDFEDFIDNISPDTVKSFGGVWSMNDRQAADVIRDARIVSYASNQYVVEVNGAMLMSNNQKPFVFSYNPELAARDSYKGKQVSRKQRRDSAL